MSFSALVNLGVVGEDISGYTVSISGCTGNTCQSGCSSLTTGQSVNSFPKSIDNIPDVVNSLYINVDDGPCAGTNQCIDLTFIYILPTPTPTNTPTLTPTNTPTLTPTPTNTPTLTPTNTPTLTLTPTSQPIQEQSITIQWSHDSLNSSVDAYSVLAITYTEPGATSTTTLTNQINYGEATPNTGQIIVKDGTIVTLQIQGFAPYVSRIDLGLSPFTPVSFNNGRNVAGITSEELFIGNTYSIGAFIQLADTVPPNGGTEEGWCYEDGPGIFRGPYPSQSECQSYSPTGNCTVCSNNGTNE
jgi:hypothetical protein